MKYMLSCSLKHAYALWIAMQPMLTRHHLTHAVPQLRCAFQSKAYAGLQ